MIGVGVLADLNPSRVEGHSVACTLRQLFITVDALILAMGVGIGDGQGRDGREVCPCNARGGVCLGLRTGMSTASLARSRFDQEMQGT